MAFRSSRPATARRCWCGADGGTRTAAITGAWVALADAVADARAKGLVAADAEPLTGSIAAVSVGLVYFQIPAAWSQFATGAVILGAVSIDGLVQRQRRRAAAQA